MSSYTLTISPDDVTAPSTTVRVDYTADGPRITGLHIDAGTGGGVAPDTLPVIDLGALLRALAPVAQSAPAITGSPAPAAGITPEIGQPAAAPVLAPVPSSAAAPDTAGPSAAPGRGRRAAARTSTRGQKAATGTKPAKATRTATAPRSRRTTTSGGAATSTSTTTNGKRPYRRVPHDIAEVFRQAGNVAGVADHYQVPRHTAQAWVSGARRKGQITTP